MPYPFAAAEVLTAANLNAMIGAPTQNNQTGTTYSLALLDAGKTVTLSNASAVAVTLPAQATVAWADNTQLNLLNLGAGTVTIAGAAGVTINGTPLTLATSKGGSLVRTASNTWTFVPFSGGVGNANFSDTATGTYTDSGVDYKYITYTGSGTLTVTTAGFADVLIIGGGGGGGGAGGQGGGGGAGGYLSADSIYLPAESITVTVGGGGAGNSFGNASRLGSFFSTFGGRGQPSVAEGFPGGSGSGAGGGGGSVYAGGAGISGQGNNGGSGFNSGAYAGGGGGGADAVGGNATSGAAGNGGAGKASSITGTSVTRAGGGGGGSYGGSAGTGGAGGGGAGGASASGTAGGTNTGGGGGGGGTGGSGAAGGSGIVIIRVVV